MSRYAYNVTAHARRAGIEQGLAKLRAIRAAAATETPHAKCSSCRRLLPLNNGAFDAHDDKAVGGVLCGGSFREAGR